MFEFPVPQICYSITTVGWIVVLLVLNIIVLIQVNKLSNELTSLLDNWKQEYIMDVSLSSTSACLSDSSYFYLYKWPGTNSGCHCTSGRISSGSCCSGGKKNCNSCYGSNINSLSSRKLYIWEYNSQTLNLCFTRLSGYSFFTQAKYLKDDGNCPSGEDICGSGEQKLCVPTGEQCPIRKMVIDQSDPSFGTGQTIVAVDGSWKLYYTREDYSVYGMSQTTVKEGTSVCTNADLNTLTPGKSKYVLLKNSGTCDSGKADYRWTTTGNSLTEDVFFNLNSLDSLVLGNLPDFVISSSYSYYGFTRNYIRLGMACRGEMSNFDDMNHNVKLLKTYLIITVALISVVLFYYVFIEGIFQFAYIPQTLPPFDHYGILLYHPTYFKDQYSPPKCFTNFNFFFKLLIIGAYSTFIIIAFIDSINIQNFTKKILDANDCLDLLTTILFKDIKNNLNYPIFNSIFALFLFGGISDPNVTYFLRVVFKKSCQNQVKAYWQHIKNLVQPRGIVLNKQIPQNMDFNKQLDSNSARSQEQGIECYHLDSKQPSDSNRKIHPLNTNVVLGATSAQKLISKCPDLNARQVKKQQMLTVLKPPSNSKSEQYENEICFMHQGLILK